MLEREKIERLLVRATNWLGDAVMSLPALGAIRQNFPKARITMLALDWVAELYRREGLVDEILRYPDRRGLGDWRLKWRLAGELSRRRFDAAILLQNAFEAALIAWLARIPIRLGYDRDGRKMLLTHPIPVPRPGEIPRHESFYYLELLRRAGVGPPLPKQALIRFTSADQARQIGRERLDLLGFSGDVIGVSPGAAYGDAKRWLKERFAQAAIELARKLPAQVAIFGAKNERLLCEAVAEIVRSAGIRCENFAGRTSLGEFMDLVAACRLMLTNDSGAMHVASALGVPTVTIFGPTDPLATGPTGPLAKIVREPVDCSPCLRRTCPIDHRCMTRVSVERVVDVAIELLG
ncbi:MAG: lipopolysaccharide heptosyltransferase II [Bryobacteraceae bacterium]|nr:lipopolysaccharide heptosyltransferase II [Bryobacteraceae bacterium]MDW8377315.1 lipopolysaccharide heptosyltransferase II [Bryobacterales bacterium]